MQQAKNETPKNEAQKNSNKNQSSAKAASTAPATAAAPSPPEGYEEVGEDVVGFWDEESPIHVIPFAVKLFDGNIEPQKPSALVFARLVDSPGDIIGIWGRPGLAKLAKLADSKVFITPNGVKETGKPNPMKLFKTSCPKVTVMKRLPITDDYRKESRAVKTVWAGDEEMRDPGDDSIDF
jgi:hypothetical protein